MDPPRSTTQLERNGNGAVIVDVREQHEFEEPATSPAPSTCPRGHLESRIEGAAPDTRPHVVLYCASGNRSALAANTLHEELGYENVESMTGGITLWKDRGYEVEVPRALTAEQRERYSRHLLVPEIGLEGQHEAARRARCCCSAPAGSARRPRSTSPRPASGTLGIVDDDVVDLSNLQRQVIHTTDRIGIPQGRLRRAARSRSSTPTSNVVKYPARLDASNIMEIIEGYDVIVDGVDNFPTRYLLNDATRAAEDPGRVGLDPRLRRPAVGLQALRRPLLPLPLPDAAAGRAGAVVRRQRRARRAARARWACCRRPRSSS